MDTLELEEKRTQAGQEILALKETIPSTLILNQLGAAFRKRGASYWIANLVLLNLLLLGPWLFIGLFRDGLERTRYVWVAAR